MIGILKLDHQTGQVILSWMDGYLIANTECYEEGLALSLNRIPRWNKLIIKFAAIKMLLSGLNIKIISPPLKAKCSTIDICTQ